MGIDMDITDGALNGRGRLNTFANILPAFHLCIPFSCLFFLFYVAKSMLGDDYWLTIFQELTVFLLCIWNKNYLHVFLKYLT